jgi:cystathionine gamma-lyase
VLLVVDNTFATPINTNPLLLGADIVSHSLTKYIGGHSDVVMGAIMLNDKALYDRLFFTIKSIGSGASPFDCYLALRGSKTLHVRVERAMQNAQKIADYLEKHSKVARVIYPGLKSHPQYELCKKQSRGPGAMISFYIKGDINTAERFLRAVKIFTLAESLGGVESLIENPALMTHFSVPPEQRKILGIEDNFIRISVGIEEAKDLLEDIKQALEKA